MKLTELQREWNEAGRTDPFWAVLSDPEKKGNRWKIDEFFETGLVEIEGLMRDLGAQRIEPGRDRALDFGCGPGRLSQALVRHFAHVDGVDISPSMIELARRSNRAGDRVAYHVNDRDDLQLFESGRFDLVYSSLTLQHVRPPLIKRYLREFLRVLRPSGVAVFQIPSRPTGLTGRIKRLIPDFAFAAYRRIAYGRHPAVAMYGLLPRQATEVCIRAGGVVVNVSSQPGDGKWESYRYIVLANGAARAGDIRAHTPPPTPPG
jgi:SAM-dependent methyltransferase